MQRADSLAKTLILGKIKGRRRGQLRMTNSMHMSLSKFWEIVKSWEALCAAAHGVAKSQTWLSDWTMRQSLSIKTLTYWLAYFKWTHPLFSEDVDEFYAIGGEEYFSSGICIIEWGELIEDALPETDEQSTEELPSDIPFEESDYDYTSLVIEGEYYYDVEYELIVKPYSNERRLQAVKENTKVPAKIYRNIALNTEFDYDVKAFGNHLMKKFYQI